MRNKEKKTFITVQNLFALSGVAPFLALNSEGKELKEPTTADVFIFQGHVYTRAKFETVLKKALKKPTK